MDGVDKYKSIGTIHRILTVPGRVSFRIALQTIGGQLQFRLDINVGYDGVPWAVLVGDNDSVTIDTKDMQEQLSPNVTQVGWIGIDT
jgi:hypothetical protein